MAAPSLSGRCRRGRTYPRREETLVRTTGCRIALGRCDTPVIVASALRLAPAHDTFPGERAASLGDDGGLPFFAARFGEEDHHPVVGAMQLVGAFGIGEKG